jgi:hypothetical protein
MELKELDCKNCGAPIENKDIDWDLAMARCSHCGAVFGLQHSNTPDAWNPQIPEKRHKVPMPKNIKVQEGNGILQISYRWFRPMFIFMLIFSIFWNGFMVVWHGISIFSGAWFMSLFGLLHTAVGIGIAYYTLTGFINHTTIWVGQGRLVIRHHPLPWWGNKEMTDADIRQIYCTEKVHQSDNSTRYSYEVHAVTQSGDKEKLLSNLGETEQALYIEQELERHLGIRDQPIRGELPR